MSNSKEDEHASPIHNEANVATEIEAATAVLPENLATDIEAETAALRQNIDDATATWGATAVAATINVSRSNISQLASALGAQFFASKTTTDAGNIANARQRMREELQSQ